MKKPNRDVLKMNRNYYPLGTMPWNDAVTKMYSLESPAYPTRIGLDENGEISVFDTYFDMDEWEALEPIEGEEVITTAHSTFIVPSMIICAHYDKIPRSSVILPTKANIWKRDGNRCQYTNKLLSTTEGNLSIDHVIPKSRGGGNTWENLVTCDRDLNTWKGNRLPEECDPPLKLLHKPVKPINGLAVNVYDEKWLAFLKMK